MQDSWINTNTGQRSSISPVGRSSSACRMGSSLSEGSLEAELCMLCGCRQTQCSAKARPEFLWVSTALPAQHSSAEEEPFRHPLSLRMLPSAPDMNIHWEGSYTSCISQRIPGAAQEPVCRAVGRAGFLFPSCFCAAHLEPSGSCWTFSFGCLFVWGVSGPAMVFPEQWSSVSSGQGCCVSVA